MKNAFILTCYYLGLWGFLGFFATLIFGFIACCTNLSQNVFFGLLTAFAAIGLTVTAVCVSRGCKKFSNIL